MVSLSITYLFVFCCVLLTTNSKGKQTYTFSWQSPTDPSNSVEDEDGQKPATALELCRYALTTTREVLDMQTKFLMAVIQQYQKIKQKKNIIWMDFENVLLNCQSIIEYDLDDIRCRLVEQQDSPGLDLTETPLKPSSISNLIHDFNYLIEIAERDQLDGIEDEMRIIYRILDNAEAELHRFNYRVRKIMKRVAKRLSSMPSTNQMTEILSTFS